MDIWPAIVAALFGETDERFVMHRYYSSRFALVVGMLAMTAWIVFDLAVHDRVRQDLVVIIGVMAVAKLVAMAYYRVTH